MQRALKLHGAELMGRELYVDAAVNKPADALGMSGKPVEGCWFCLSNPNADVNLIASIGARWGLRPGLRPRACGVVGNN